MKKRSFLIILITITLLSSILLSSILGVTKAEYFKKLSKALDFEAKPDLALQYYLVDANPEGSTSGNHGSDVYHGKTGVYKDAKNILQPIAVGTKDGKIINKCNYFFGDSIVYQIKIPVDEEGYYTLDFTVDFLFGGDGNEPYNPELNKYGYNSQGLHVTTSNEYHYNHPLNDYYDDDVFAQHYQYAVGCEVLNADDRVDFGTNTPLKMPNRVSMTETQTIYDNEKIYYADKGTHSVYQWKTLTPTRAETVKLSFKATDADVTKGYVIWAWDFTGIKGQHNYRISITGLDVNKVMNSDGTTKYRSNVDPYFMFPQTSFTNNQVFINEKQYSEKPLEAPYYRGSNTPGKTCYSGGRGTFITEATENSLGLRAESLYHSVYQGEGDGVSAIMTPRSMENNPVSLQIPIKNIKYNTTYKVTFDISLARQGNTDVGNSILNNAGFDTLFKETTGANNKVNTSYGKNLYDYAAFEEIFPSTTVDTQFRSYLYSSSNLDAGIGISNEDHKVNRNQIVYANKDWNNQKLTNGQEGDFSLTKYNYVTRYNMAQSTGFTEFPKYTTLDEDGTVNDPFCTVVKDTTVTDTNGEKLEMTATTCRNWYNAVQHVEQNGQQGINWITFYNTTFSFNIDSTKNTLGTDERGYIKDLYWIWQIDALEYSGWYNIRIDNVRIQEVVQYSSEIEKNGVKIADTQIGMSHMKYYGKDDVTSDNVFANYRGWNGTGQNCDARGYDTENYYAVGNIYAPIIDARKFSVAPGTANDYKIYLDGWAVCKGGINKYVYSADGGKTWHDMTFTGNNSMDHKADTTNNITGWYYAEGGVEQRLNQQTVGYTRDTDRVTFDESDGANCNFDGYALCADLTPYKNQPDLDIIIAAVPDTNTNLRCEILRIINYHSSNHYVSQVEAITSDIESSAGKIEMTPDNKLLAITSGTSGDGSEGIGWVVVNKDEGTFRYREGNWPEDYYPTSNRGVMAHINAISAPIRYDNIATMASDIPIKTTLKVQGYMVCGYGVYGYAYSVDGGNSWIDIPNTATSYVENTDYKSGTTVDTDYEKLLYKWITHSGSVDGNYFSYQSYKGKFNTSDTALSINLSAYEGQVVDVIVAAKPYATSGEEGKKSDIYLPITKIDNVAVYGKLGTFYTRLHRVVLDQCILEDDKDDAKDKWASVSATYPGGSKLARTDKWSNFGINDYSYTIFEPNNVNAINARLYYTEAAEMQSGGRVTIDGYVVCKGGVRQYKYSLDGGKTWTVINDSGMDINDNSCAAKNITMIGEALKSDNTFDLNEGDGENGDYCCYYNYEEIGTNLNPYGTTRDDFYEHAIEFNLPALPAGAERNLLVVAESTNNKLIPVLHIKLKFKQANGVSQYGYHRTVNTSELSNLEAGYISTENNWDFIPVPYTDSERLGTNKSLNRFTIPVTEEGEHMLRFVHTIKNGPSTTFTNDHPLRQDGGALYTNGCTADITLSANKTHYLEGETISVDFTITRSSVDKGFGPVRVAIISEDWLNQNGEQHALYVQQFTPLPEGVTSSTTTVENIKVTNDSEVDDNANTSQASNKKWSMNSGLVSDALNLKAGKYSIVLIYRHPLKNPANENEGRRQISDILKSETLRERYVFAEVPIYIHAPDEKVEFTVVHDNGEYTYFSDLSTQLTSADENVDLVYTLSDPFKNTDTRAINAVVNVTKEDVKRGYIVFESNYTGLWSINEHTKAQCEEDYGSDNFGNHNEHAAEHADGLCVSRESDNGSTFTKKWLGNTMYDHSTDIKHTGITYETSISFGYDALTKKPSQTLIDTFFATKDKGYGNNVLMSTATKAGEHKFSYDPILNPPIRKGSMKYIPSGGTNLTDPYNGSYLSVSKTYFDVGEPIIVDYKTTGVTANNVYVYITSAQICNSGKYGDLYIKQAQVTNNTAGTLEFTASTHNLKDNIYDNDKVKPWASNIAELNKLRKLPAGEYKIWLVNNGGSFDPYNMQRYGWNLVTEPISIKVIDPANPDLSMTYWSDRTYANISSSPTALTLNKVVYEQGEDIPFRISGEYNHVWVTVVRSDDFTGYTVDDLSATSAFAGYLTKNGTYARYAEHGSSKYTTHPNGHLKTVDGGAMLEPGQYKVVYLFGQCLQDAWGYKTFTKHNSSQKIMAIIDITIVPKNTLQKYSASYVKNDGSVGNILLDGNEFENFENLEKLENLTQTVTTLNDSTFTVKTTPVKHNVTLKIPNDVNTSLKNNVAFNIQTLPGNYSFNEISDGKTDYNAPFYSANLGSGTAALKIPVSEAGTYDLSFGGYLNSPIAHRGYKKNGISNWTYNGQTHKLTLDYTGAYMSVPKAVYTVGEVIPISYYSRGSVAAVSPVKESGNLPWIGIVAYDATSEPTNFENEDKTGNSSNGVWNKRNYVNANTEGVKYISTEGIPVGTYQIYFRDNSALLSHNNGSHDEYWWQYDMVDPITIVITDAENPVTNPQFEYKFSNVPHLTTASAAGWSTGTVSLGKNVFYQGENISVTITGLNTTNILSRLALCKKDSDVWVTWVKAKNLSNNKSVTDIKTSNFGVDAGDSNKQTSSGSKKLDPGVYTLYVLNAGSTTSAHNNGRVYATIDITILPAPTTVPVKGGAQIQSLSKQNDEIIEITQTVKIPTAIANPFKYYNVSGTFTVTQQDVERGYVIFEYNLTGLPAYSEFTFAIDNWTVTKKQT